MARIFQPPTKLKSLAALAVICISTMAYIFEAPASPRLVGLGCGPQHQTLVAIEEDEFPAPCYAVDTPRHMCGHDDARACADYLGGGY